MLVIACRILRARRGGETAARPREQFRARDVAHQQIDVSEQRFVEVREIMKDADGFASCGDEWRKKFRRRVCETRDQT